MSAHEIFSISSRSMRLAHTAGELKLKETDSASGFAVRVLENGKLGFAYCQLESEIPAAMQEAGKISRFSVKSPFAFAPKQAFSEPRVFDARLEALDSAFLAAMVEEARAAASSKGGKPRVMAWLDSSSAGIQNSGGLSAQYRKTTLSFFIECMHGDGYGSSYLASNSLPKEVAAQGLEAAEMALSMQGAGKPETGSYTVVMEVEALESLVETLMPSLSGDWKRRKISKLAPGKKAFSDSLTIAEDGLSGGIAARPFDDEGTPSARRVLVQDGIVKSFLYDRETAALEGIGESGACSRESYDSPPSIGPSNLVISPGSWKSLSELDRFIEVHYAHGSHTANISSGDISLEVSAAFMVEKGKRKPVKGFMLSGNVFDMFADIEAVESVQETRGAFIAPRIAFRDVRVVS